MADFPQVQIGAVPVSQARQTAPDIFATPLNAVEQVADFTTLSQNHSFIANGIITHNCGLITNAALSCVVTIGTDPEPVKEIKSLD